MPKRLSDTRHFQVTQELRRRIAGMKPGDPLPTVAALKHELNVSQATLERALIRLRADGLVHREMGQRRITVAQFRDKALRRITLLRPDWPSADMQDITTSVAAEGRRHDWVLRVTMYRRLCDLDIWQAMGDSDAAILLPDSEPFPNHLKRALAQPRRTVVVIQQADARMPVSSVAIDDRAVGRLAVEHLAGLGHRRICAVLSEPPTRSATARIAGWRDAMVNMGMADELDALFLDSCIEPFQDAMVVAYEQLSRRLRERSVDFTALFVISARGAMAALRALREANIRVPEDISVVGYAGDAKIGPFMTPPLTAIETDRTAYGNAVVSVMEEELSGKNGGPRHVWVPPYLEVRGSTGPCRAAVSAEFR